MNKCLGGVNTRELQIYNKKNKKEKTLHLIGRGGRRLSTGGLYKYLGV